MSVSPKNLETLRACMGERPTLELLCKHKRAVILVQDLSGRIRDCAGDTQRLFGVPPSDLVDVSPQSYDWKIVDEHGQPFAPDQLPGRLALTSGRTQDELVGVSLREGEPVWVSLVCHPLVEHGETIGVLTTMIDVSALQLTRQALASVEARLREQHKMEALERMAAAIAHDFNNLLSVILSQTDCALADYEGYEPLASDLKEIRSATERAVELTRDLLAVGRVQHQAPASLELNGLVEEFAGLARALLPGVTIDWRPGVLGHKVLADRSQLEQIVLNLLVNASEAMEGKGRVVMRTEQVEQGGETLLLLSFKDEGRGMTPEVAARAFEPFYTTKPAGPGTGMGLATVYGIVAQSGGRVDLKTAPGKGTEVLVWLRAGEPLSADVQALDEDTEVMEGEELSPMSSKETRGEEKRPSGSLMPLRRRQPTALVVLGQERDRRLARKVLERRSFRVIDCALADEARCLVHIDAPLDVLICSHQLLDASGVELASELMRVRARLGLVLVGGDLKDPAIAATFTRAPEVTATRFDADALQRAVERVMRARDATPWS